MKGVHVLLLFIFSFNVEALGRFKGYHAIFGRKNLEHRKQFREKLKAKRQHEAFLKLKARRELHPRANADKFPLKGIQLPGQANNLPLTTPLLEKMFKAKQRNRSAVFKRQIGKPISNLVHKFSNNTNAKQLSSKFGIGNKIKGLV